MPCSPPIIVFALAPPRSGLTPLEQCLRVLGLRSLGDYGFSGPSSPALINRLLLQDLQRSPLMVGNLNEVWLHTEAAKKAQARIESLLCKVLSSNAPALIADAFLCRVLPLWLSVLRNQNIEPRFIHLVRHPNEVARSLATTEGVDATQAHLLWTASYRDALVNSTHYLNTVITFDQLLADPVATVNKISRALAVDYPNSIEVAYQELKYVVQPALKHHYSNCATELEKTQFAAFTYIYEALRIMQFEASGNLLRGGRRGRNARDSSRATIWAGLGLSLPSRESEPDVTLIDLLFDALAVQEQRAKQTQQSEYSRSNLLADCESLVMEIRFPRNGGTNRVEEVALPADQWHQIILPVPQPKLLRDLSIRFTPLHGHGTVLISAIKLLNRVSSETLWAAQTPQDFDSFTYEGSVLRLTDLDNMALVVTGNDPLIKFPAVKELPDCPMALEVWIKASRSQNILKRLRSRQKPQLDTSSNLVWLASYPRSGNTLIRTILNHNFGLKSYSIYNDKEDIGKNPELADVVGHEWMDWSFLGKDALQLNSEDFRHFESLRRSSSLKLVKTHSLHHEGFNADKAIYIFRDGRASLRSFAAYRKTFYKREGTENELLDELLCNGDANFGLWDNHILSWMGHPSQNILFLKYEDVISDYNGAFKKLATFLNIEPLCTDVIEFQHLQNVNPDFFRRGQKQSWRDLFNDTRNALYWALYYYTMSDVGYNFDKSLICEILSLRPTGKGDVSDSIETHPNYYRLIELDRILQSCAHLLERHVRNMPDSNKYLLAQRLQDTYSKALAYFCKFPNGAGSFAWTTRWETILSQLDQSSPTVRAIRSRNV